MQNIYKNSKEFPYHISVGAVLVNNEGLIACECYPKEMILKFLGIERDVYTLMRETIEDGETILDGLHRGLLEEFGVKGDVLGYLGSLETHVLNEKETKSEDFRKTTLYFLVRLQEGETLRKVSEDTGVTFYNEWMEGEELIRRMNSQSEGLARTDLNESEILQRALQVLSHQ